MQNVELVRWKHGVQKVACTRLLQTSCNLALSAAKATTDALLDHKQPLVAVSSQAAARDLIVSLASLGVVARFAESIDYKPEERFDCALSQVASLLPSSVLASCRSLATHGEWELALSHCLAALRIAGRELSPVVEKLLGEVAVEYGIVGKSSAQNGA